MATVPVTRTWVAGEVVLASHFNTNIRDVLNYLLAPPIMELEQDTTQSLTTSTWTALTFTTEVVDSSGMHSTSSNTSRATAVYPGYYRSSGCYGAQPSAAGARYVALAKNGTRANSSVTNMLTVGGAFDSMIASRSKLIFKNVNDYTETQAWQNTGGNLSTVAGGEGACSFTEVWESN